MQKLKTIGILIFTSFFVLAATPYFLWENNAFRAGDFGHSFSAVQVNPMGQIGLIGQLAAI